MRALAPCVFLLACASPDSGKLGGDTSPKAGAESGDPSEGGAADGTDGGEVGGSGDGAGSDGDSGDSGSGDGADGAADSGGEGAGDSGRDSDEPPPPPPPTIVRFLVLGDGGEGNKAQYAVADAMLNLCAAKTDDAPGCDFVLYLGDNFYDDGVSSADDEQFQTKFELPYAELAMPFYVVLGNHDYGSLSLLEYKAEYEVEYTDTSESGKWYLPDRYYSVDVDHLRLFGLDTNRIMLEVLWGDGGQPDWFDATLASSTASWNIAFGHHPYISNGQHGNAGEYEGYEWLPIANGETIKAFVEDRICGEIDVYFAGHDHNRQWLEPTCGTEFIVSGAAAKTTDLEGRGTPTLFEDDSDEGFMWVELRDDHFTGEFYNSSGTLEYSREFDRTL